MGEKSDQKKAQKISVHYNKRRGPDALVAVPPLGTQASLIQTRIFVLKTAWWLVIAALVFVGLVFAVKLLAEHRLGVAHVNEHRPLSTVVFVAAEAETQRADSMLWRRCGECPSDLRGSRGRCQNLWRLGQPGLRIT